MRITGPAVKRLRRLMLEQWIEEMIWYLDRLDGDPDLEDDELEDENEHGGDVQDEPHDPSDDDEHSLGWPEQVTQRGIEMAVPFSSNYDVDDGRSPCERPADLDFDGSGYRQARNDLARLVRRRRATQWPS